VSVVSDAEDGASIAAKLPALWPGALAVLRDRAPCPVATYRAIRRGMMTTDLSSDAAEPIRRGFNAYYGVRRNAEWRSAFYRRFESAKTSSLSAAALFDDVVAGLVADTGRVEASFASKLVATLRPNSPIVDSVVRGWLGAAFESPPFKGGPQAVGAHYRWLERAMTTLSASREAEAWADTFEAAFPTPPGADPISTMKRLDFLIWAGAPR
jgi:hypothetical protein